MFPNRHIVSRAILPLATLALLAGCAPSFEARVARFSALPPEATKSFAIEARNPADAGGLEFATYANLVRKELLTNGFVEAASPAQANVVVLMDYGMGTPQTQIQTRPGTSFNAGWGGGWGRYGGPGWGGWGWNPYWGGGWGAGWGGGWSQPEVYSVTRFPASFAMKMVRNQDKVSLFEGRAETLSTNSNLTVLMPSLVRAMFTQFPGTSGQTVRVTFNPTRPDQPANVRPVN